MGTRLNAPRFLGRRSVRWSLGVALSTLGALLYAFPGDRFGLAFTIATGVGHAQLQHRIDLLEERAVRHERFSEADRAFLHDFYSTLATGGKLVVVARQTGRMMDHYLAGSGTDYRLDTQIFTSNKKVQAQVAQLRKRAHSAPCIDGNRFSSGTFYMPDASNVDSIFGLYYGSLLLTEQVAPAGKCALRWRAEVPWVWPSYASLRQKYGNPHAESFPLPNLKALLLGRHHSLFVDNGLGHHLEELGLARSFLAFAEWPDP